MAVTDRMSGSALKVYFIHSGGTADLSGDFRKLDVTREQEVADATAAADAARAVVTTVKKFGASMETMFIGTAGSAIWGSASLGVGGTLRYAPKGTSAGNPKGEIPVVITKQDVSFPFDDVCMLTVEFTGNGNEVSNPLKDVF
jgi:hypothetical protein